VSIPVLLLLSNSVSASAVRTKHFGLGFFGDDDDMVNPFSSDPFGMGGSFFGHRAGRLGDQSDDSFFNAGYGGGLFGNADPF
jgi:hypothetical protein